MLHSIALVIVRHSSQVFDFGNFREWMIPEVKIGRTVS